MTRPPRIRVGEFSAEKTGTVTSFRPIPIPRSILSMPVSDMNSCLKWFLWFSDYLDAASWPQVCETAMPNGAISERMAATKMTPRRPRSSLRGSEIQPALVAE
ncbi:hypothetical protein CH063_13012 [Colletotrichum higginsianum]|uniref:Uncharacterized protein n=1 Tax=Colletotrichum higginsianum (strain IMI 349063) TaxID=759273 RepID=H1VSP0_COLHI|nr:hypothetical protein CH063_13012 [Colletotrichum higginsianum]